MEEIFYFRAILCHFVPFWGFSYLARRAGRHPAGLPVGHRQIGIAIPTEAVLGHFEPFWAVLGRFCTAA